MKTRRGRLQPVGRDRLLEELVHDSYKAGKKLPEPTRCPDCAAAYINGRWSWASAAAGARQTRCPACQRIHDRFPAGFVRLEGSFLQAHREEILHLIRNHEAKEKAQHPLQRIMAIEEDAEGVTATTTDIHLARDIALALELG